MTTMSRGGAEFWLGKKLPYEVAYLYHDQINVWGEKAETKWIPVTFKEILNKKKANQDFELKRKRLFTRTAPCFIHVFYNDHFPFGGWWIYVITLKRSYGINFRIEHSDKLIERAMQLFPCGIIPLKANFDEWAEAFAVQHVHIGFKRNKNQGLILCKCTIDENDKLIELLT